MYEDQQKWERFRDAPSSDQRLGRERDHHGPPSRTRTWIAVAVLVALVGVGFLLLATNTADESDPSNGVSIAESAA